MADFWDEYWWMILLWFFIFIDSGFVPPKDGPKAGQPGAGGER